MPMADMPADRLTKLLPRQKFEHFRSMLGLVDIQDWLNAEKGMEDD